MLWLKTFHIVFVVCWFAGIFYLPRLFVYHAMSDDKNTQDTFKVMERKLYRFITPFGILTLITGITLATYYWPIKNWLIAKFLLVLILVGYHFYLGYLVRVFANDENQKSHKWYRVLNEVPVLFLFVIVFLVVLKPF